jgi:hypothetical protein
MFESVNGRGQAALNGKFTISPRRKMSMNGTNRKKLKKPYFKYVKPKYQITNGKKKFQFGSPLPSQKNKLGLWNGPPEFATSISLL